MMSERRKAFLVGAGIGALAAAVFMLRDGGMRGEDVTIFDAAPEPGGSLDATGDPVHGYVLRGSRMMTTENFECTWALLASIPSLHSPGESVRDVFGAYLVGLWVAQVERLAARRVQ